MKINLAVSEETEGTASPYWLILDPKQNMGCDIYMLANQITGPFFSREEADKVLKGRRHHYSERARVFCNSGCYSIQYDKEYRKAENELTLKKTGISTYESMQKYIIHLEREYCIDSQLERLKDKSLELAKEIDRNKMELKEWCEKAISNTRFDEYSYGRAINAVYKTIIDKFCKEVE